MYRAVQKLGCTSFENARERESEVRKRAHDDADIQVSSSCSSWFMDSFFSSSSSVDDSRENTVRLKHEKAE